MHAAVAPAVLTRIRHAFERNALGGLLHLGASELAIALPPSLAFGRELAHLFMTRLCAVPDLARQWESLALPAPQAELAQLLAGLPPMVGAEYLDMARLETLWADLLLEARAQIAQDDGDVQAWLAHKHPSWNLLGRVCFHLAENKANPEAPFAFLATYGATVSQQAKVQHVPLGRALQEYAGSENRDALLRLLMQVHKASEKCPWLAALVASGAIFHARAWSPQDAHQFLQNIPLFEASGIVVRIPDWWKPGQPSRPQVQVNIGQRAAGLGLDALLDFDIAFSLGDEVLTEAEWAELMAAGSGLVRLKGRWVEVDQAQLDTVLAHWNMVQRRAGEGISFLEGMRLLAGVSVDAKGAPALAAASSDWSRVVAGDWLKAVLHDLRNPAHGDDAVLPGPELKAQLRPYQQDGVRWLHLLNCLGLGGCLADDMGLGKTVQVLALLLIAKRGADPGPHLLVLPASLIGNWQAEMARFAPGLSMLVAHPSAMPTRRLAALPAAHFGQVDVVLTTYGTLMRVPALRETHWSIVVLDEAQAIKNPGAQQTRSVKSLHSRVRFALTGTPVENSLGDLWSLFDFICPGLLGSAKAFAGFVKRLEQGDGAAYAPLRKLVQPYILRRLKSDKRIIGDLPDKTEIKAYCALSRLQVSLYQAAVQALQQQLASLDGIARRGAVLAFLMRFKQICNHPAQWSGDGQYAPEDSGKFARLRELAEEIAARQEKVLVFTQFQEMTAPLHDFLQTVFKRPGLVLHGGTAIRARKGLVEQFQDESGPPFFVLSIKAGGTGLNLTAAAHVIHFDRWWNPAVENQASDRAYRIGQKKNVLVHKFICRGTVEEKIDALIEAKQNLSNDMLEGGAEASLTEMSNDELIRMVSLDINSASIE
ncbi:DEAD/DEAH box helicase [Massilia cavernae]|uniref:DEAD/DEAH box helicase n=1 Tax=Massilia cavernae TaxID=2320864 RepID=UPI0027D927BF|nr:DEAD/DEAH box helicase [Massilia cavernae]